MATSIRVQRRDLCAKAQVIRDDALEAGRDLTEAELGQINRLMDEVDTLDAKILRGETGKAALDRLSRITHPEQDGAPPFGGVDLFTPEQKAGIGQAVERKGVYATKVDQGAFAKAAIAAGTLLPTSGDVVSPNPPGTGAVLLRDLFPKELASGPTVRVYRMGAATAGVVAEGGVKPDAGIVPSAVDTPLIKIANLTTLTDELVEDAPGSLIAGISGEAVMGLVRKENEQIVSSLSGASGIQTSTGTLTTAIDVIATSIGSFEALVGVTPTALLINPTNLATIRAQKASTGGSYFIDPLGNGPTTIHGVRVYSTGAVPAGTVYLVAGGSVLFYFRSSIKVDTGYTNDDFSRNQSTLRVEERVLPAVIRPSLVMKVTLT